MMQINTYEQFQEIKNNAVRIGKMKKTNFLIPDSELKLHILNRRAFFEETDKCLCVIIKIRQYNYLYFWCADEKDTFIPQGVRNVLLTSFTNNIINNSWTETAEKFGLKLKSKLLQVDGKVQTLNFPEYPENLRSSFKIEIKNNYSYDYYAELTKPYFDYEEDIFPEEYIWEGLFKNKLKLIEVKNNEGELAAFYTFVEHNKLTECYMTAVFPKYRGLRIVPLIVEEISHGYDNYKTWIQDRNTKSLKVFQCMGIKPNGNYRVLYGG